MSGLVELKLQLAVAAALEASGYSADDPAIRDQVPAAIRGTNLAVLAPPAAAYAVPALAGLVTALAGSEAQALVLVPAHALEEWAAVVLPLSERAGLSAAMAATPGRATRPLREGRLRLLLTTPTTALALLERSALKTERLGHIVLGWPELFESEDSLAALMQDLAPETQRIIFPVDQRPAHPVIERYARRALLTGPLAAPDPGYAPVEVRVARAPYGARAAILAHLVESEDPASLAVWCLDDEGVREARQALPVGDASVQVVHGDAPRADLVIAWDLPAPARLAQLRAAGPVLLLAPAHATRYVTGITSRQTQVRIPTAADSARDEAGRRRSAIRSEIERGDLDGALLALLPLFERYDPASISAALYRLWLARPMAEAPVTAASPGTEVARVWVGTGKKDGCGAADLVGVLTRELGIGAQKIGRIELRELYSLVEVPAEDAEAIARALSGKTIRRRQVVARVDRGRPNAGSRGPSGPSPRGRPARPKP